MTSPIRLSDGYYHCDNFTFTDFQLTQFGAQESNLAERLVPASRSSRKWSIVCYKAGQESFLLHADNSWLIDVLSSDATYHMIQKALLNNPKSRVMYRLLFAGFTIRRLLFDTRKIQLKFCLEKSVDVAGFSTSSLIFLCLHYSAISPFSYSSDTLYAWRLHR
jgi:hypothetical protein